MLYLTPGVVLRAVNYREHDRMLTLLTPDKGRLDAVAYACRRIKSPLLTAAESFCSGEYGIREKLDKRTVTSCAVADTFYPLRLDYDALKNAAYCAGLCARVAQPDLPAPDLHELLLKTLAHLAYGGARPGRVTAFFLFSLTRVLGFQPDLSRCVRCGKPPSGLPRFDVSGGGVACEDCAPGQPPANPDALAALAALTNSTLETMIAHPLPDDDLRWARDALRTFVDARIGPRGGTI